MQATTTTTPWFSRLLPEFRVGYVDYSGCGLSDRLADRNAYSVELFARNLKAIADHLEVTTLSLIGISFGGLPAVEFALDNSSRLRRLVLSNAQVTAAGWQHTNIDGVNAELARLYPAEWREILDLRSRGVTSLDERYHELVGLEVPDLEWLDPWGHPSLNEPDHDRGLDPALYEAVVGADPEWEVAGTLRGYDRTSEFGELPKTLVVSGRYDRLTPPEVACEIYALLDPNRRALQIFERSAHRPWVEEPERYFETVKRFLTVDGPVEH